MPFGLKNLGAYFSLWVRNLHEKLPAHLQKNVITYLDDLLVHTPDIEHNFLVLSKLFKILQQAGCVLNSPKC